MSNARAVIKERLERIIQEFNVLVKLQYEMVGCSSAEVVMSLNLYERAKMKFIAELDRFQLDSLGLIEYSEYRKIKNKLHELRKAL